MEFSSRGRPVQPIRGNAGCSDSRPYVGEDFTVRYSQSSTRMPKGVPDCCSDEIVFLSNCKSLGNVNLEVFFLVPKKLPQLDTTPLQIPFAFESAYPAIQACSPAAPRAIIPCLSNPVFDFGRYRPPPVFHACAPHSILAEQEAAMSHRQRTGGSMERDEDSCTGRKRVRPL